MVLIAFFNSIARQLKTECFLTKYTLWFIIMEVFILILIFFKYYFKGFEILFTLHIVYSYTFYFLYGDLSFP